MELRFAQNFLSISELTPIELPNFTVITGENGAGKSQLLQAISQKFITVKADGKILDSTKIYSSGSLLPSENTSNIGFGAESFSRSVSRAVRSFWANSERHYARLSRDNPGIDFEDRKRSEMIVSLNSQGISELTLKKLEEKMGKNIQNATEDEIDKCFSLLFKPGDPFTQSFSDTFSAYYKALEDNKYGQFLQQYYDAKNNAISKEEFIERFGPPPWETANEVLKKLGFNYQFVYKIENPDSSPNSSNRSFQVFLKDGTSNVEIKIENLSSGEKTILEAAKIAMRKAA